MSRLVSALIINKYMSIKISDPPTDYRNARVEKDEVPLRLKRPFENLEYK